MTDELTSTELEQFKSMEKQESEERAIIEKERSDPESPAPQEQGNVDPEPKEVPLAALHEERERRKAAEESARQTQLQQARLEERLRIINERIAPPEQQADIPDPDKDALGALKATAEEARAFREFRLQQANNASQQTYENQVIARAAQLENDFIKETPDYNNAGTFLSQSRMEELTMGLGMDPISAQAQIKRESLMLADTAIKQGKNPAQIVYQLAKSRGYTKSTTNVQQAQPETDVEKLARISDGQRRSASLGSVNSTPPKPQLDGKQLIAMSDEDFSKWLDKLPSKERSKFLGA